MKKNSAKDTVVAIVGPTATGKSEVAIELARLVDGEIVSADSMLVYKHMDIGTAKPSLEQRKQTKHYLIDIVKPNEAFDAAIYQNLARGAIEDIFSRNKTPILVGGTGLYVRAAVDNLEMPPRDRSGAIRKELELRYKAEGADALYDELLKKDPAAAKIIDKNNKRRLIRALEIIELTGKPFTENRKQWEKREHFFKAKFFGLIIPRENLYDKINERVGFMIEKGLVEETEELLAYGFAESRTAKQALGYKEILDYINGKCSLRESVEAIKKRTRNYAKRQMTWFKADPRIIWVNVFNKSAKEVAVNIFKQIQSDN
jgi:tRNA dimethylallyltransferase